jgi:hypothetical protein
MTPLLHKYLVLRLITIGHFQLAILIFGIIILNISCNPNMHSNKRPVSHILDESNVPPQPGTDRWKFIEDLKSPMWTKHPWEKTKPQAGQADLSKGVTIKDNFPDPKNRLETAYDDLRKFLSAGDVSIEKGEYQIETVQSNGLKGEAFRLEIEPKVCRIVAGDVEGIRRGIFHLEDQMLRLRAALLQVGKIERQPFVKRRISRCVYGPIKRPPAMRDELMDSVDYYPDQYLNRLAHEGVNGLWLTVDFRDLVSTTFTPRAGKDLSKRIEKLKRTVTQCLRFGIRTYIFTIEPRAWGNLPPYYNDIEVLKNYPELGGVHSGGIVYFCPFSETSRQFLYQEVNNVFKAIPDLGGIINISYEERATTCLNTIDEDEPYKGQINCPRCSKKQPWEILQASLTAMEKGMHDAAPDAELISWLYMGVGNYADWVYDIAAHTPKGVILQLQFETGVTRTEFGRKLIGGDYWLSTPGPSESFEHQAKVAVEHGTPVSAKLQTGNSHEIASIPYVLVPSMVYRKFEAMHRLGVSHAMLGWYFGNYPGPMIKSAGELSFEPFPENEEAFLKRLASVYWRDEDVPNIVEAWKAFAEGYGNYPLQNKMGYYGPMHDGPVWPLLLKPLDAPLSPTWQIASSETRKPWPPRGDRIGECLWSGVTRQGSMDNVLTLEENMELCQRMSTTWDKGVAILNNLESKYRNEPDRMLEIGLAKALGIQFQSGYNILHFYQLREEMLRMEGKERMNNLKQLENIIYDEIESGEQLIKLCEKDSRLGFHSEAEGYKYFPEKIRWRIQQLKDVLSDDVPEFTNMIKRGQLLYPEYTGKTPVGNVAYATVCKDSLWHDIDSTAFQWQTFKYGDETGSKWSAAYNDDALYIIVSDPAGISDINVKVEPRRLFPCAKFTFNTKDETKTGEQIRLVEGSGKQYFITRIPFKTFWWKEEKSHPVRVDVSVQKKGTGTSSWCPSNPLTSRLIYGTDNPADLGWLIFK